MNESGREVGISYGTNKRAVRVLSVCLKKKKRHRPGAKSDTLKKVLEKLHRMSHFKVLHW